MCKRIRKGMSCVSRLLIRVLLPRCLVNSTVGLFVLLLRCPCHLLLLIFAGYSEVEITTYYYHSV